MQALQLMALKAVLQSHALQAAGASPKMGSSCVSSNTGRALAIRRSNELLCSRRK